MLALLVLAGVGAFRLMEVTRYESTVLIVAHRGASRHAPENTLSSIREAIRQGADCSEIDVQSTVDGVVILMHDSDLKRIADLPQRVDETTFEEIRKLDAGAWFGEEFEGEKVPTLQEAMNVARGKIHLNIEVKPYGEDPSSAAVVAELIKKNKFADQCVVTSFDANVLRAIKAEVPDLQVGLIVGAAMGDLSKVDADFLSVHAPIVDARFMKRCRERDKEVYTWTVNNREQMIRLTILGVNAIITDEPGVLHELRQRYEELTHSERVLLTFRLWLAQ